MAVLIGQEKEILVSQIKNVVEKEPRGINLIF